MTLIRIFDISGHEFDVDPRLAGDGEFEDENGEPVSMLLVPSGLYMPSDCAWKERGAVLVPDLVEEAAFPVPDIETNDTDSQQQGTVDGDATDDALPRKSRPLSDTESIQIIEAAQSASAKGEPFSVKDFVKRLTQ